MAVKVQAKLPAVEDIDRLVVAKIRKVYDYNEEMKLLRKGLINPKDPDFIAYNDYIEKQRRWGKEKKRALGLDKVTILSAQETAVKRKGADWLSALFNKEKHGQKEG